MCVEQSRDLRWHRFSPFGRTCDRTPLSHVMRRPERDTAEIPTALDLPQVPASEVITTRPVPLKRPDHPKMPAPASPPAPAASDGGDITDWI